VQCLEPTLDWEVEIAAVLGSGGRHVDPRAAAGLIAGYCTANDLTVRARVTRPDVPVLGSDWLQSKGGPGTLPLGPWFVPAWQVGDVASLRLRLWVNGELMQDDLAQDMIFPVGEQVAYLSRHTALRPGDVLCTGSPAGFGAHYGRYLRPGDLVAAEVSGLGRQEIRLEYPREELAS
jgi:2-keto-4-pentenoate hydratase/2-oxohepta-3-ene-1,7-dioic acid hydratase in catechol pathway